MVDERTPNWGIEPVPDESDEAFADIYSTAVSLQNLFPRVSQRLLIVVVGAVATIGADLLQHTHPGHAT